MEPIVSLQIPSPYNGTQFLIRVQLPSGKWTTAQLHPEVSRLRIPGDFRPNPYFLDSSGKWWTLTSPSERLVQALVWMIRLEDLMERSRESAELYLQKAIAVLSDWATGLGATLQPESSIPLALEKLDRVRSYLKVFDYEVRLLIVVPQGGPNRVEEWWQTLEEAGLEYGDGNLFWKYDDSSDQNESLTGELFCAEPFSSPGYFHLGDFGQNIRFPDLSLHFRVRDVKDPLQVLREMAQTAESISRKLGASVTTMKGTQFHLDVAEAELHQNLEDRRGLGAAIQI